MSRKKPLSMKPAAVAARKKRRELRALLITKGIVTPRTKKEKTLNMSSRAIAMRATRVSRALTGKTYTRSAASKQKAKETRAINKLKKQVAQSYIDSGRVPTYNEQGISFGI